MTIEIPSVPGPFSMSVCTTNSPTNFPAGNVGDNSALRAYPDRHFLLAISSGVMEENSAFNCGVELSIPRIWNDLANGEPMNPCTETGDSGETSPNRHVKPGKTATRGQHSPKTVN